MWDVCFTIKGKAFVTACADALIRIWQVGTGNVVRVLRGHTAAVSGVCFSPLDGRIVCRWLCLSSTKNCSILMSLKHQKL